MLLALAGRLVQFVVMFLTVKLMTTYLQPEEFGKVSLITAVSSFFAMFLINPIGTYVNRHLHQWQSEKKIRSALFSYSKYLIFVALMAFLLLQAVKLLPITLFEDWWIITTFVVLNILIGTANQTLIPSLNLLGYVKEFTYLNVLSALLALCFAVALVYYFEGTAIYWLFGILIGQGLATLTAVKIYYKIPELNFEVNRNTLHISKREILFFAIPVSMTAGFVWLNFQGYRLVLANFITLEKLGLFAAGYGLAVQMVSAAELILNTWFHPKFYQHCDSLQTEVREAAWSVYAQQISIPMVIIVASGIMFAPLFVNHILGPAYQSTVHFYQMGLAIELIRVLIGTSGMFFHQHKLTKQIILPNASGALFAVGAMGILVSYYGDVMIIPALGMGAMITLSWTLLRIKKIQPIDIVLTKRFVITLLVAIFFVGFIWETN